MEKSAVFTLLELGEYYGSEIRRMQERFHFIADLLDNADNDEAFESYQEQENIIFDTRATYRIAYMKINKELEKARQDDPEVYRYIEEYFKQKKEEQK